MGILVLLQLDFVMLDPYVFFRQSQSVNVTFRVFLPFLHLFFLYNYINPDAAHYFSSTLVLNVSDSDTVKCGRGSTRCGLMIGQKPITIDQHGQLFHS